MLILFWVVMILWLVLSGHAAWRDRTFSDSFIAWLAVAFLALLTVGFPK